MRAFALLISLLCEQDYLISRVNAMWNAGNRQGIGSSHPDACEGFQGSYVFAAAPWTRPIAADRVEQPGLPRASLEYTTCWLCWPIQCSALSSAEI